MAEQQGFLDQLGIGSVDEGQARRASVQAQAQRGAGPGARNARLGAQASPLLRGGAAAVGGLITGRNDGRSVGGFAGNLQEGIKTQEDRQDAQFAGITPEQLRSRREIRKLTANFKGEGDFDARIALAKKVAAIANRNGDFEVVGKALQQVTELEKEKKEFQKLGIETETKERELLQEKEVGFDARHVNDKPGKFGKAVRINEGPDTGRYRLLRAGQPEVIVDGAELHIPGVTSSATGGRVLAQDTLQGLVRANGGLAGKMGAMRGEMKAMGESAIIVGNIANVLLTVADPQAVLSTSGKAAINVDKSVSFVESVSSVFTDPRTANTDITYNGEKISTRGQHDKFVAQGTEPGFLLSALQSITGERGGVPGVNLDTYLPKAIRGNALAAEQYWASVMELAYLDARLKEPSNRGLSDNDIINALKRIGADTANPLSFAVRQKEVIATKLLPALDNLGKDFTNFESPLFTKQQIVDQVYSKEVRADIRRQLLETDALLTDVLTQGRRGENRAEETEAPTQTDEEFLESF